jgi:hypothetical protein
MAIGTYPDRVDVLTIVLAITGVAGLGSLIMAPVLLALAVSNGRERRWIGRHPVSPCAAMRPRTDLPERYAVYGETVPGRDGPVVAPLSGEAAVWYRTTVHSAVSVGDPGLTRTAVLWDETGGDPFGVADGTGTAAVSATILQASTYQGDLSLRARTRHPVGWAGPAPVRTVVDEETTSHRRPGPWLQQFIDRGLVPPDAARGVDRVTVTEQIVPRGVLLHVIGKPAILDSGALALTLPRTGRYLVSVREPAETERILAGDRTYGTGCAVWAALVGAASFAVFFTVALAVAR